MHPQRLQQQINHLLRPAVPDLLALLLVHIHQLPDVVGVAQAVRAVQPFVADQSVVHQHALDALQQTQCLESGCAAFGVRGQPGQCLGDGAVQPVQCAFDTYAGLIRMDDA